MESKTFAWYQKWINVASSAVSTFRSGVLTFDDICAAEASGWVFAQSV